jgi:hypothetical protein
MIKNESSWIRIHWLEARDCGPDPDPYQNVTDPQHCLKPWAFLCMRIYHEAMKVCLRTGTELGQDGENPRRNVQLHLLHSLRAKPTHMDQISIKYKDTKP